MESGHSPAVRLRMLSFKSCEEMREVVYAAGEQLVEEVFELLMEFKPVSDKSEEPLERSGLAS